MIDLSWRQFEPAPDTFDTGAALTAIPEYYDGLDFASLDAQLAEPGDYWLRFWVSDVELAPDWIAAECAGLAPIDGEGYENDTHWPIWDTCFWTHASDAWRELLETLDLDADPRMRFAYAPGAFTWSEFDFDLVEASGVTFPVFDAWFSQMTADLAGYAGANVNKIVYTGEDFPFSSFGAADDFLAYDAAVAGMGVRTGITEVFNFHLNHVPSYGTTIDAGGHMVTNEIFVADRVLATENECYQDCGFSTDVPYYAVKMSNLKALQLRMDWIYVVPDDSFMDEYAPFWEWVRLSIGKTPYDSPDAWVALREAEDLYWTEDGSHNWAGKPFVRNLERWVVERELEPTSLCVHGDDLFDDVIDGAENGRAWEGRRTGSLGCLLFVFDVDSRFLSGVQSVDVKVTIRDTEGAWAIAYASSAGDIVFSPRIERAGAGGWVTETVRLDNARFDDLLTGPGDFSIVPQDQPTRDVEVRFVRVVKVDPP